MNPADTLKMVAAIKKLADNHPKVVAFLRNEVAVGLPEGSILELKVTKPGDREKIANMRITADDLEAIATIKETVHKNAK